MEVRDCRFARCDGGIDVVEGAQAIISGCSFTEVDNSVCVSEGSVVSRGNSMENGNGFTVGKNANIDSQNDSLIHTGELLYCSNSSGSIVTFVHATVCSHSLMGIDIGKSLVHPNRDGKWVWASPKVVIADSIIYLESNDRLSIRYAPSALPEWGEPRFNVWDYVELSGPNLVYAYPEFLGSDPKFGEIDDGKLSLRADSPAIGTASDGTNLGAWQGNVK